MSQALFSFSDLLARVAPSFSGHRWKVVRHLDTSPDAPDLVELFHTGRSAIEFYQSYQGRDIFKGCDGFFSFLGLPGRRAQFMAAYRVKAPGRPVLLPEPSEVPPAFRPIWARWKAREGGVPQNFHYELERDERFASLEMRPVIDWGNNPIMWHQWDLNKPVLELRHPDEIGECPDFGDIEISLAKLKFLVERAEANPSWPRRLGSVAGIYLLTDHANDKLYVGQAGGDGGFWARWANYARRDSGNVAIDTAFVDGRLGLETTTMSILEVIPRGAASKPVLDRLESRWKERLRSRIAERGYNLN